jgi:hypothetical protein
MVLPRAEGVPRAPRLKSTFYLAGEWRSPYGPAAPMGVRTRVELTTRGSSSCFPPSGRRALHLLGSSRVEERLKVLTELLFLWGHRLRAGSEDYSRCSEVLRGLFGNDSPMNIIVDA